MGLLPPPAAKQGTPTNSLPGSVVSDSRLRGCKAYLHTGPRAPGEQDCEEKEGRRNVVELYREVRRASHVPSSPFR